MQNHEPLVRMEHIYKTFNPDSVNEVVLFEDFNLSIKKGRFVSVIGSNGSGKTTILNLLCGSLPVDQGKIYVGGKDITGLKEYQHSAFIGRVFQDPSLGTCPSMTILENMALADRKGKPYGLGIGVNKKRIDFYKSQLELLKLGLENKINYGDRLVMMHRGNIVIDKSDDMKDALVVRDLTDKFNEISIEDGNSL